MEMFNKISYQVKNKTDKNYRNKMALKLILF